VIGGNESGAVKSPLKNSQLPCWQAPASHFRLNQERRMPWQVKSPRLRQTSVGCAKCKTKQPRSCKLHDVCILADQPESGQMPTGNSPQAPDRCMMDKVPLVIRSRGARSSSPYAPCSASASSPTPAWTSSTLNSSSLRSKATSPRAPLSTNDCKPNRHASIPTLSHVLTAT